MCARARPLTDLQSYCCTSAFHTRQRLPSAAGTLECACLNTSLAAGHDGNGKRETHGYMMRKTKASVCDTQTTKDKSTDVWRQTRRRHSSSTGSPPQHSREGPPGLAVVAQPHLPRVAARQGWVVTGVKRSEEDLMSCGKGRGW